MISRFLALVFRQIVLVKYWWWLMVGQVLGKKDKMNLLKFSCMQTRMVDV